MKKIFLSADIEGTCGIAHWDETRIGSPGYDAFALQMSREVAAACEGALAGGADEMFVKDAHGSGRNIDAHLLPHATKIFRGWGRDPYCMMSGLDESFAGVMFTGYHSAADTDGNPLAHTMNGDCLRLTINGEVTSELYINCLIAAMLKVPVLLVTGDAALCDWVKTKQPHVVTVPVNQGVGNGAVSMHPDCAVEAIHEAAKEAAQKDPATMRFPLPDHFDLALTYKDHFLARRAAYYPGAVQTGPRSVAFKCNDYMDALRFMLFCL